MFKPLKSGVYAFLSFYILSLSCFSYGGNNQYALGITVPSKYCKNAEELDQNFLPDDNAQQVKAAMNGFVRIYRGTRLIGARPKPILGTLDNYHSEYLLLINSESQTFAPFDPLMQNLLNSNTYGCTVFFTLNSPCVNTCSSPGGAYSIIPALQMFQSSNVHQKAFVFRKVWDHDVGKPQWKENLLAINNLIPVYRCDDGECTRCVKKKVVNQKCLQN